MVTKTCLHCNKEVISTRKEAKFCSQSCSATYHNLKRSKVVKHKACIECGKKLSRGSLNHCSLNCQQSFLHKERVQQWIKGNYSPAKSRFFRRYLTETHGYKCSCCGISEWNDKALTLEIDHIDGRSDNNRPENLRLICPNCHSQTDTYKSKNRGNGRHYRRERYKNGLSY